MDLDEAADLVSRLDHDLGTPPTAVTSEVHLAIQAEQPSPGETSAQPVQRQRSSLVGREAELTRIERSWSEAAAGAGHLVLVDGVGGIGKTHLLDATADLAEATGALVIRGRGQPAERSLFRQPFVSPEGLPVISAMLLDVLIVVGIAGSEEVVFRGYLVKNVAEGLWGGAFGTTWGRWSRCCSAAFFGGLMPAKRTPRC